MAQTTKEIFARTKSMKRFTLEFAIKLLIYDDGMAVELKAHPHSTSGWRVFVKLSFLVVFL